METEHLRDATKMVVGGSFPHPWHVVKNDKNGLRNIVVAANGRPVAEPLPIDGATREDCEAVAAEIAGAASGDAAAMREALEAVKVAFDSGTIGPVGNYPPARLVAKVGRVMEKVEKALAAPPHKGMWKNGRSYEYEYAYCSECGRMQWAGWDSHRQAEDNIKSFADDYRFCPGCGAEMEGGEYVK